MCSLSNDVFRGCIKQIDLIHIKLNGDLLAEMIEVLAMNPGNQIAGTGFEVHQGLRPHWLSDLDGGRDGGRSAVFDLITQVLWTNPKNDVFIDILARERFQ